MTKRFAQKGDTAKYRTRKCSVRSVNEGIARIKVDGEEKCVPLSTLTDVKPRLSYEEYMSNVRKG